MLQIKIHIFSYMCHFKNSLIVDLDSKRLNIKVKVKKCVVIAYKIQLYFENFLTHTFMVVLYDLKLELRVFNLQSKVNHIKASVHDRG